MDATEDRIADAIAAELNDATRPWHALFLSEGTTAVATHKPWNGTQMEAPKTLKVFVVPLTIADERIARGVRQFDYGVSIDLQRLVDPADETRIRALAAAAEAIHDWFANAHELAGLAGWTCLVAERADVYSLTQLYADGTWETLVAALVRGTRAG